jgi:hypothetical protein
MTTKLTPTAALPPGYTGTRANTQTHRRSVVLTGLLALLVLSTAACGGGTPSTVTGASAPPATPPAAAPASDPCDTTSCIPMPDLVGLTVPQARDALSKAGLTHPSDLAAKDQTVTIMGQVPSPGAETPTTTKITLLYQTPPAPPEPAKAISARDWALIAKDPSSHTGERIIVYGQVKQFDAATGTSAFRANVDGVAHKVRYGYADYETNTYVSGTADLLKDLVNDDLFRAEATVSGAYSYETTMGGQITVPKLEVTAIKVTGSAK